MATMTQAYNSPQDSCNEVLQALRKSSLHFLVNESPYSIQICLRKRFLKDTPRIMKPSEKSEEAFKLLEKKCEALAAENMSLVEALEEANEALQFSRSTNEILHSKIDKAEEEVLKSYSERKEVEAKSKDNKKKHDEEIHQLQSNVKVLNKSIKSKEKEIYDLTKYLDNSRETVKSLKTEKSTLKDCKSKLESQVKKLENKFAKVSPVAQTIKTKGKDLNKNSIIFDSLQSISTSSASKSSSMPSSTKLLQVSNVPFSLSSSMVSHWNPIMCNTFQRPASINSMVTHCAKLPSPGSYLLSMEEVLQELEKIFDKHFK